MYQLFKVVLELVLRKSSCFELFLISSISSSIPTSSIFPLPFLERSKQCLPTASVILSWEIYYITASNSTTSQWFWLGALGVWCGGSIAGHVPAWGASVALQLCRSHCRGLRSWCGVCPLAHWQPTCQPLASEMLPWTGCDIGGAERSLKSFKLHY